MFVCTFIPCVRTKSKCRVFTSNHMLIDYQTGFKWCGVNPWAAAHTQVHTQCFEERFSEKRLMDQS